MSERLSAEERERYDQMLVEAGREVIYTKQQMQELTLPITDKSICSRGHPRACLEHVPEEFSEPGKTAMVVGCSACTQLEAELKPLREALKPFANVTVYSTGGTGSPKPTARSNWKTDIKWEWLEKARASEEKG